MKERLLYKKRLNVVHKRFALEMKGELFTLRDMDRKVEGYIMEISL